MAALDLSAFGSGGLKLQNNPGSFIPQGPSLPGYLQGTANTVRIPNQSVQNAMAGPGYDTLGAGGATRLGGATPVAVPSANLANTTTNQYGIQGQQNNALYDQYAGQLHNQLSALDTQKTNLLDRIGATYGGLVQSAKDTLQKNVGLLEGNKTDVNQSYDVARQNEARLLNDTERQNRVQARASGLLGSSFYANDLQGAASRTATQRIGGLNTEEQSKLDAIGSAIVNANTDTNTKIDAIKQEQASAQNDILAKFQDQSNQINTLLSGNERERLIAQQDVQNRLQGALDQINLTFGQYANAASGLGATAQTYQQQIAAYDPTAAIQPTLSQNTAYQQAYSPLQSAALAPSQSTAPSIYGQLNLDPRKKQQGLDFLNQ